MVPFKLSRVFGTIETYYISEAVTVVSSEAFVNVVTSGGTIVLDGHDMELETLNVSNGSVIQVKLLSSSEYGHTSYASLQIEDQSSYFAVTTDIEGALVYDYTNENLPLAFSATAQHLGDATWQPNINPRLHILRDGAWQSSINLQSAVVPNNEQRAYAFVADRWANKVYRIDLSTNTVAQSITLPSPVAIGRIAVADIELGEVFHYIVALQNGDIVRLDPLTDYAPNYVGSIEGNAVDLTSDEENNSVWVVASSGTCVRFAFSIEDNSVQTTSINLAADSLPSAIERIGQKVYVTLFGKKALAVIDVETTGVALVPCCVRPVAITYDDSTLFVAGHDAELSRIQLSDFSTTTVQMEARTPTFIRHVNGALLVSDHKQNQMMYLSTDGVRQRGFNASKPLAVFQNGNDTLLFTNVSNALTRLSPGDNSPTPVEFIPRLGRDRGEQVTSNTYKVSGVNLPVNVSVDPLSNSTVIINGVDVGTSGEAEPGDLIAVATTLPNEYEAVVYTDVTVGDYTTIFIAATLDQDSIPNSIVFDSVENAVADTQYDSNAVVISGLGDGTEANVFVENAILLLNGSPVVDATVQNGDTVALRIVSGTVGTTTGVLRIGPIEASFFVQISDPTAESVLPFAFVDVIDQPIGSIVRSNTVMVDWLLNEPMGIRITDVYSASIILNGELIGAEANLYNGDEVAIEIEVTSGHFIDHVITIFSDKDSVQWTAKTVPDLSPKMFSVATIRNGWLRQEYPSEEIVISGLTSGYMTDMTVQPEMPIILDGVRINDKEQYTDEPLTFPVANGSIIQFIGIPGPVYGTLRQYTIRSGKMETFFKVYARPVEGAYENPSNYFLVEYETDFRQSERGAGASIELGACERNVLPKRQFERGEYERTVLPKRQFERITVPELRRAERNTSQGLTGYKYSKKNELGESLGGDVRTQIRVVADTLDPVITSFTHSLFNGLGADAHLSSIHLTEDGPHSLRGLAKQHYRTLISSKQVGVVKRKRKLFEGRSSFSPAHIPTLAPMYSEYTAYEKNRPELQIGYFPAPPTLSVPVERAAFQRLLKSEALGVSGEFGKSSVSLSHAVATTFDWAFGPTWYSDLVSFINVNHPVQYSDLLAFVNYAKEEKNTAKLLSFGQHSSPVRYVDLMEISKKVKLMWFATKEDLIRTAMLYTRVQSYFEFMGATNETSSHTALNRLEFKSYHSPIHVIPLEFEYQGKGGSISVKNRGFSGEEIKVRRQFFETLGFAKTNGVYLTRKGFTGGQAIPRMSPSTVSMKDVSFVPIQISRSLFAALDTGVMVKIPSHLFEEPSTPISTGAENKFTVGAGAPQGRSFVTINDTAPPREYGASYVETFEDEDRSVLTPELMLYHSSAEDAYQGALDAGVEPGRIQTHELYTDCWVWAEVLDQPDLCEVVPDSSPESGWIKGG